MKMISLIFMFVLAFSNCNKPSDIDLNQPSNLQINIEIAGKSTEFPNGDGSGLIKVTATSENTKNYKFLINDEIIESENGYIEYTCDKYGLNEYSVFVTAYNQDKYISLEKKITVFVEKKLVWSDEFDKPNIDKTKWEHEVNGDGGGNIELQYYTYLQKNSYIQDGKLIIKAINEKYQNKDYTSARLRSKFKGD